MIVECRNIFKNYSTGKLDVPVLKDVNFSMEEGEYVAIMGPSGSGKSTLMNIIGCLDQPTSGELLIDGQDVSKCSSNEMADVRLYKLGFVFQNFQLLAGQTALQNVELPLTYAHVPRAKRRELAAEALARVGLEDRMNFMPNQLSGGQKQRVAIARAIVNDPKLLLADGCARFCLRQAGHGTFQDTEQRGRLGPHDHPRPRHRGTRAAHGRDPGRHPDRRQ